MPSLLNVWYAHTLSSVSSEPEPSTVEPGGYNAREACRKEERSNAPGIGQPQEER